MTSAYFGAYWGPRASSADESAEQVADLLTRLAEIDPLLAGWRDTANSKEAALQGAVVTTDTDDLSARVWRGVMRDDDGSVIEDAGFSLYWWNGHANGEAVRMNMTLGRTSAIGSNVVVIDMPDLSDTSSLSSMDCASRMASSVIEVFRPERAVWVDEQSAKAQRAPDSVLPNGGVVKGKLRGHTGGWLTYLADGANPTIDTSRLPSSAVVSSTDGGTLVVLGGEPTKPSTHDILAVRQAMGYPVTALPPTQSASGMPVSASTAASTGFGGGVTEQRADSRVGAEVDEERETGHS